MATSSIDTKEHSFLVMVYRVMRKRFITRCNFGSLEGLDWILDIHLGRQVAFDEPWFIWLFQWLFQWLWHV